MFHNLYLNPDQHGYIKLENISLQKGTFVKFQPFRMIYINEVFNQQVIMKREKFIKVFLFSKILNM